MIVDTEKTEFKHIVDPKLTENIDIKVGDKKITNYSDIVEDFPINKDQPLNILVHWDDICQYTSIGLIEVLNNIFELDAKVDLEHFFNRPNEYINGIKYVYKLFEKSLTADQINTVKKKFYWKILQISLKSELFTSLVRLNSMINNIIFYFPYKFENCETLKAGMIKLFTANNKFHTKLNFEYADNKPFNSLIGDKCINSVITPNVVSVYNYILEENIKKVNIISTEEHNGIDEKLYELIYRTTNLPKPNNCTIDLYREKITM
jgi:hypothetical protein